MKPKMGKKTFLWKKEAEKEEEKEEEGVMGQPDNFTRTLIIRRVGRVKTPNAERRTSNAGYM